MTQGVWATEGAARSVQGARGGLCETAVPTATDTVFTVTAWKGRYVKIQFVGSDGYYLFSDSSSTSLITPATEATLATAPSAAIPDYAVDKQAEHELVPNFGEGVAVYLHLRAVTVACRGTCRAA
jgi:hypothetical protein